MRRHHPLHSDFAFHEDSIPQGSLRSKPGWGCCHFIQDESGFASLDELDPLAGTLIGQTRSLRGAPNLLEPLPLLSVLGKPAHS